MCDAEDHKALELFEDTSDSLYSDSKEQGDLTMVSEEDKSGGEQVNDKDSVQNEKSHDSFSDEEMVLVDSKECDIEKYFTSMLQDVKNEQEQMYAKKRAFADYGKVNEGFVPDSESGSCGEIARADISALPTSDPAHENTGQPETFSERINDNSTQSQAALASLSQLEDMIGNETTAKNEDSTLFDADEDIQGFANEISNSVIKEARLRMAVEDLANRVLRKIIDEGVKVGADVEEVTQNLMREVFEAAKEELTAKERVLRGRSMSEGALWQVYYKEHNVKAGGAERRRNTESFGHAQNSDQTEMKRTIQELRQAMNSLTDECMKTYDGIRSLKRHPDPTARSQLCSVLQDGEDKKTSCLKSITGSLQKLARTSSEFSPLVFEQIEQALVTLEDINYQEKEFERRLQEQISVMEKYQSNNRYTIQHELGLFFYGLLFVAFVSIVVTLVSEEDFFPLLLFLVLCIYYIYKSHRSS